MLNSLADFYDEEIETDLGRFVTLIEPALLVIMGIVIAGLLLALYMPLFQLVGGRVALAVTATAVRGSIGETRPSGTEPRNGIGRHRRAAGASCYLSRPSEPAVEDRGEERRRARRLAERYGSSSSTWSSSSIDHELFRIDPGRPDAALRVRAVPPRGQVARGRRVRPERPADDRRAGAAARRRRSGSTVGAAVGDPVDPQEERELAARARGGDRELPAAAAARRTRTATTA